MEKGQYVSKNTAVRDAARFLSNIRFIDLVIDMIFRCVQSRPHSLPLRSHFHHEPSQPLPLTFVSGTWDGAVKLQVVGRPHVESTSPLFKVE
jgi:hypothetical protein